MHIIAKKIYLSESLCKLLKQRAESERRSVSSLVEQLLRDAMVKKK
jgi:hypothetical protein